MPTGRERRPCTALAGSNHRNSDFEFSPWRDVQGISKAMPSTNTRSVSIIIARCDHWMSDFGFSPRSLRSGSRRAPLDQSHRILPPTLAEENDAAWRGTPIYHGQGKLKYKLFHSIHVRRQPLACITLAWTWPHDQRRACEHELPHMWRAERHDMRLSISRTRAPTPLW